ncbi:PQQ-binding-like beta-propeller repeat protein [Rubripirellula reticaptiva]|uniref:Outer membrane protein assembly factor BamB n=1 Tax=Rubripirellula reticaptiva TaxID=2528013 RepID=A0A5C6F363_9BACT|nr:PQQ-binding-like beta-propeller repeat protein [Rubripirellula reticaptiva]TWU55575.1 Outer membrane protein assembly factor BamB precursor [Rubripirellula reticaptiva]
MRQLLSLVLLLSTVTLSGVEPSGVWNQWRGPTRDSQLPGAKWPGKLQENLQLVWEKPLSPSYSGPVVSDGLVFTTETIGKQDERVTAFRLSSGEVAWSAQWPGSMTIPFFAAANGDWIRSTPACTQSHLVVMGMRDVLVCLKPKTGEEIWRVNFPESMKTPMPAFGAVCSPLIDDDAVYVQTGGGVVKLNLDDGSLVWKTLENGADMMSSGAFSSPVIATIADVRQLVVQTRTELCGVDLQSGEVFWKEPIEAFRGMNILTPLVFGNRVFTAAHSGKSQLFEVTRSAENDWGVNELWSQNLQGYMSSPVLIDDTIYLHMKNQRVAALAVEDGTNRWTSSPFGKYWSMVSNGDDILALDSSGELRLIDVDESQLKITDEVKVADDSWAHVAVLDGLVIVRDLTALKVYRWK